MARDSRAEPNLFDEPGLARALRLTLVAILASSIAVTAFTLILKWPQVPRFPLVVVASTLVALAVSRSGRTRLAVFVALAGVAYAALHAAAKYDGIQSVGLATLPVLLVLGSLVLDRLKFVFFTAATILATIGMLAIRYFVLRIEPPSKNDLADFFVFVATCATAALIGRLLSVRIQEGYRLVRASERRYRGIFENIQDVYYEMQADGTLGELSPAGAALFGVPREGMIGRPLAPFCVNPPEFDALLAGIRARLRVSNRQLVIRNSRGDLRQVLVNASLATSETGEEKMIGSIRDITERKRAEEALRESEARLRLALEATGAGTFDFYPQSGKVIWSDITKSHFGMSPKAEVTPEIYLRAIHPDDRERIREKEALIALPGSDGQFAAEYRVIGVKDGKERWIAARGRVLFDAENRPVRLIGTTLDISERKRLEEELRRRAEELQKIMDCAPVALLVAHDPECRVVTANRTANTMHELPPDANSPCAPGVPTHCRFFRDGIEVPVHEMPLQTAARGREVRDFEFQVLLPSGRRRLLWGHASPLRDAAGQVRGAIAAAQDITETRQRADALLRESEERFRNTADAAPVIIWFGDTEKRLTFVNEQMTRFTGLPAEQVLGHGWAQVIHPDDLEAARAVYNQAVESRTSYQLEYRVRRADGEYRHMLGTASPRYVGREYVGHVGSVIDITDLKRRHDDDIARQKWESLGTLAAGIAHDFNNLLGGILSQTELALSEFGAGEPAEADIRAIQAVAVRGAEIVRQLMVYSGQKEDVLELVDVSHLIRDSLELLKVVVSKHAVLEFRLATDVPPVLANPGTLRQILMNLVTNSSEAIGEREGVIRISTSGRKIAQGAPPEESGLPAGDYLRLDISDTGEGISPERQAQIFDPFFTTKAPGRGLGLPVVQGIVNRLGGAITVGSTPHGTDFQILLPGAGERPAAALESRAAAPERYGSTQGTILVVEDEEALRNPISRMLRKQGFTVLEAGDGSEALDMIRAHASEITAMLLDVTLPGASSPEILREALRCRPDLRVIVTSAFSEETIAALSSDLGAQPFLRKPYRLAGILKLLN
jgi:PAS domain S-box-containing protein